MNLREVLSAVLGEVGFLVPESFFGSTSPDDLQMCYLANRASSYIREQRFQKIAKRYSFTLTTALTYPMPTDFLEIIPDTMMVDGRIDAVNLPTDPSTWAYLKSMTSSSSYTVFARIMNDLITIHSPTVGSVVQFEYISNSPVLAADAVTYKERFTADTDTWLLDADLLILEIQWRFLKMKGLPEWEAALSECKGQRNAVLARDKSAKTLGPKANDFLPEPNTRLWV